MTNKEVCLRLSSPERKKKVVCAGGMAVNARGSYEHSPVHNNEVSGTGVQLQTPWHPRGQQNQLVPSRVYTKVQKSARPSWVVSVPSVRVKLSCVCTPEQTQNPSSGIELLCGRGIFRSKPKRDCDVLSPQAPVFQGTEHLYTANILYRSS